MPGELESTQPQRNHRQIVCRRFPASIKRRDQRLRVRFVVQPQVAARLGLAACSERLRRPQSLRHRQQGHQ